MYYTNQLIENGNPRQQRPESQSIEYDHLSPKAGIIFNISELQDVYLNYRHGFRAPSVGNLFRAGSNTQTTDLKPVKTDSIEIGLRGLLAHQFAYEIAFYHMEKTDDIVTVINNEDNRQSVNAGETTHQGIELGFRGPVFQDFSFNTSFSYTNQEYGDFSYTYFCFSCSPQTQETNFDGNDVGKAPKTLGNLSLRYEPQNNQKLMIEIELEHVGKYYTDETNTQEYSGHDLFNVRTQYQVTPNLKLYGRIQNLTDKRYSTYTSNQVGSDAISYRPGAPLTVFTGVRAQF